MRAQEKHKINTPNILPPILGLLIVPQELSSCLAYGATTVSQIELNQYKLYAAPTPIRILREISLSKREFSQFIVKDRNNELKIRARHNYVDKIVK